MLYTIMHYLIALIFCLFLFPLAFADIGPSPSYSFSIDNASDFSEYKFYYAGNIWPEQLTLIEQGNSVYKLNTKIKVYAVPLQYATQKEIPESEFAEVSAQSIVSDVIDLQAGETVFEVKSFSKESNKLVLEKKSNVSDVQGFDFGSLIISLILAAGIIVLVFFAVKSLKNKGKK